MESDNLEDLGVVGDNIKVHLQEVRWRAWTGLVRVWMGIGIGLL